MNTTGNQRLIIIGNGFDLAHGLATSYSDFVKFRDEDFFEQFRIYLDDYKINGSWTEFENRICELTAKLLPFLYDEEVMHQKIAEDTPLINEEFSKIRLALMEYLRYITTISKVNKLSSVARYFTQDSFTLSFNYTNTAEIYTNNVRYVHGSLLEDNILLGYDFRHESELAGLDVRQWSKAILRDALAFDRYVRSQMNIGPCDAIYSEIMAEYNEVLEGVYTMHGFEDEDLNNLQHRDIIKDYLDSPLRAEAQTVPNCNYDSIEEIVVMGHGLCADEEYLKSILEKCINLQMVVIFSYEDEPEKSWQDKKSFFLPYCVRVIKELY